ncbi:MAG: hypothetical protein OEV40_27425 [Acidimicrobiia bacterium]|nr:hypothetical protein [Acidimicrobiia bacterium]
MIKRVVVLIGVVLVASGLLAVPPAESQTEPMDAESQERAAEEVMDQLETTDEPLAMSEIDGLEDLGPPPWLSLTPERSEKVVEAWLEVAAQLPSKDLVSARRARRPRRPPIRFTESEAADETGANDSVDTGELIERFGTHPSETRRAIIDGNLSGVAEQFPVFLDCPSVEDDGSIPQANDTGPNIEFGALCGGLIGDGPHGDTTGDTDFYSFGQVEAGTLLLLDVFNISDSLRPVDTVVGIYDGAGNLVATAEDNGDPTAGEFLLYEVTEAGAYYGVVAGCCELQSDPFDPASGPGVADTGTYEAILIAVPPPPDPCLSAEDDGAIPLANETESKGQGDDVLFVTECLGEIGDGPRAATGDVDFYTTREMTEGKVLVVDLFDADPDSRAGEFTIGVYDAAGTLLASGQDDPDPQDVNFFQFTVPETAAYQVVISGGLPADPFDSTSGTNTDIVGLYDAFLVDITQELLDEIIGEPAALSWQGGAAALAAAAPEAAARALLEARQAEATAAAETTQEEQPAVDTDVFLVDLRAGDVITGGFDAARVTGILDPAGVGRMASNVNPSFIYPAASPARHGRRIGFDHVVTTSGVHAVFVSEGSGPYQGELRVARSGRADERSDGQQIIFLDFDGAAVSPSIFAAPGAFPVPEQDLSPLSAFLEAWGLEPDDEDAVIDAVIDTVIENLDTDLRVLDGRNGNRDASRRPTEFDIEILNSRDHGERWGRPNVSRIVIGGTIEELQIPTIGIAQSIDPGNLEAEETGVVLLDVMSGPPEFGTASLNSYQLAGGKTKIDLVGNAVGHVAAHEVGHYIGNWHTETFNPVVSLMDAGGEFESLYGPGPDLIFGTADDVDSDFAEDIFRVPEPFAGVEDTAGRSAYALSTGRLRPRPRPGRPADVVAPALVLAEAP